MNYYVDNDESYKKYYLNLLTNVYLLNSSPIVYISKQK